MKRLIVPGALSALLVVLLMLGAFADAAGASPANARQTPTSTPTATRSPRASRTPTPTVNPARALTRQARQTAAAGAQRATPTRTVAPTEDTSAIDEDILLEPEAAPVNPGAMTSQVVVFNPDLSGSATVLLDVRNVSGASVYSQMVTVNSNGARLISLPSLSSGFQGGAVVSSDKNVQAMVVDANTAQTARDAYEGTGAPAKILTLPLLRHLAANTQNSVVAVQNTTNTTADAKLTYYDANGAPSPPVPLTIPPMTSAYVNTNGLFGSNRFIGSARITSDHELAAVEQSLYYQDTASFRALTPSQQGSPLYLPLIERRVTKTGVGVNWSETFVRNNGSAPTDITIEYYSTTGTPVMTLTRQAVAPNGLAQFITQEAAFAALGRKFVGWARVTSSGQPLALVSLEAQNRGKRLVGIQAIPEGSTGRKWVCGDVLRGAAQNTTLYLLNTHPSVNAKVKVRLYDQQSGAQRAVVRFTLPPNSVTATSLSGVGYDGAGSPYEGMAIVAAAGTAAAPRVVAMAYTPYTSDGKITSATSYVCGRLQ